MRPWKELTVESAPGSHAHSIGTQRVAVASRTYCILPDMPEPLVRERQDRLVQHLAFPLQGQPIHIVLQLWAAH